MLIQATLEKLHAMRLFGIAQALNEQLSNPAASQLSFEERMGMLVDHELTYRDNNRLKKLLKSAKLKEQACIEDIIYRPDRGLEKNQIAPLALSNSIRQGMNLILTGQTGSGKTWLACAFGNNACRQGLSVLFLRIPLLLEDLAISHGDGSFRKRLNQLGKPDLLILDDLGTATMTSAGRNDLLEVVEQRCGVKSTLITSQYEVEHWHDRLSGGNPITADAILDRLVSGSHRIAVQGGSMRKLKYAESSKGKF